MIHVDELFCLGDVKDDVEFANRFFFRDLKGGFGGPEVFAFGCFFCPRLSLVRYSSFSASSIRMFMNGDVSTFPEPQAFKLTNPAFYFSPAEFRPVQAGENS